LDEAPDDLCARKALRWTCMDRSMVSTIIRAALVVLTVCVAACTEAPAAPVGTTTTTPSTLPRAARFQSSVVSLDRHVQLLRAAPAALDQASLATALAAIADSVADVPAPDGVDVRFAASTIRGFIGTTDVTPFARQTTANMRSALETAAGALVLLSRGPYASKPEVAAAVARLKGATAALEPDAQLVAQRAAVVEALAAASMALTTLAHASGMVTPPIPQAPRAQPQGAAELQTRGTRIAPLTTALATYSQWVARCASAPPSAAVELLPSAIGALAAAVDVVPRGDRPVQSMNAVVLREYARAITTGPAGSRAQSRAARNAFERVAVFLIVVGEQYGATPEVGREARAVEVDARAIDPSQPLAPQMRAVVSALIHAERAMRAIAKSAEPPSD
jgi:hypothetical protein